MKKINIGCGFYQIIPGWLNYDYNKKYKKEFVKFHIKKILNFFSLYHHYNWKNQKQFYEETINYDMRKRIPHEDDSVDFIYISHTLEHFTQDEGALFLNEAFRVLKKNGVIRIVVPDLELFIKAYEENDFLFLKKLKEHYELFIPCKEPIDALNLIFRVAGHEYIYSYRKLKNLCLQTGFHSVEKKEYGQSNIPDIPQWEIFRVDNLCVEAVK